MVIETDYTSSKIENLTFENSPRQNKKSIVKQSRNSHIFSTERVD